MPNWSLENFFCTVSFTGGPWDGKILTMEYPAPPNYCVLGDPEHLKGVTLTGTGSGWIGYNYRYIKVSDYEYVLDELLPPNTVIAATKPSKKFQWTRLKDLNEKPVEPNPQSLPSFLAPEQPKMQQQLFDFMD